MAEGVHDSGRLAAPRPAAHDLQSGRGQPLTRRRHVCATTRRIAGARDAGPGRVIGRQANTIRIPTRIRFYEQIAEADADQLTLISRAQEQWPGPWQPDVLARLIPQPGAFPRHLPQPWPTTPRKTWPEEARLPSRLLSLPTEAAWTNPLENLWRWLRQAVLHRPRLADDWSGLQAQVTAFLAQFAAGSRELLRSVGLSDLEAVSRAVVHDGVSPPLPA